MTIKKLAKLIAEREGKKKQVDIAQITEILGVLSDLWFEQVQRTEWKIDTQCKSAIDVCLYLNGEKRAKRKGKKR